MGHDAQGATDYARMLFEVQIYNMYGISDTAEAILALQSEFDVKSSAVESLSVSR